MIDRELTPEVIDDILSYGPINDLRVLPIALSMDPPEGIDVEQICHDLAFHKDAWVRGNAALAFGHLARVMRELGRKERVCQILEAALTDEAPIVAGHAADAISDIELFLGWKFRSKDAVPRPLVPRQIETAACYRIYLLVDEDSHVLVERSASPEGEFAPDPRGLAHPFEWRLPGFSLTDPLTVPAKTLEELWAMRFPKVWVNESNRFEATALVRAGITGSGKVHRYHDWLELRCRAYYLLERKDSPYAPADGIEHRWLTAEEFMAGDSVGAHDRYILALFNNYALQEMGSSSGFI